MPKFVCACGEIIPLGEIPCPHEWRFISDADFDRFDGMIDADEVYRSMKSFVRCPSCRRVWIFWNGFGSAPEELLPA
jgi:hypothetical protein